MTGPKLEKVGSYTLTGGTKMDIVRDGDVLLIQILNRHGLLLRTIILKVPPAAPKRVDKKEGVNG